MNIIYIILGGAILIAVEVVLIWRVEREETKDFERCKARIAEMERQMRKKADQWGRRG